MTKWKISARDNMDFIVVGCGGTGGYVAEGLCRLLINQPSAGIVLIDHDRVETHNLFRQNFYDGDIGGYKSKVLAERLAKQYCRKVMYSTSPLDKDFSVSIGEGFWHPLNQDVVIGCVDNAMARKLLAEFVGTNGWYIDAGNGFYSGQVLIGNTDGDTLIGSFREGKAERLPLPTIQQPALLVPSPAEAVRRDCAQAVADNEQSPIINRMMADLVLTFVHKLLSGTLSWMGAYIDLENGSLSTVNATPENVARITGHTVRQLEYRPRQQRQRVAVRV